MSDRHPALSSLLEMEEDVRDVARFGELLRTLGTSSSNLDPDIIWIIGGPLRELGEHLVELWQTACVDAGGAP